MPRVAVALGRCCFGHRPEPVPWCDRDISPSGRDRFGVASWRGALEVTPITVWADGEANREIGLPHRVPAGHRRQIRLLPACLAGTRGQIRLLPSCLAVSFRQIGFVFGCLAVNFRQIGLLVLPRGQTDKSDYSVCLAVKPTNRITRFASRSNGVIRFLDMRSGVRLRAGDNRDDGISSCATAAACELVLRLALAQPAPHLCGHVARACGGSKAQGW